MNRKSLSILVCLSTLTLFGFKTGEFIELERDMIARANPNFLKYTKNMRGSLAEGTTGEIIETKTMPSGNLGIKMKVTNGSKAGNSYWVYYDKNAPALKLMDRKEKVIAPENVARATNAETTEKVPAIRDILEQSYDGIVRDSLVFLSAKSMAPKIEKECETASAPPPPEARGLNSTYSPSQALADMNSGDLKLVGKDIMPGDDREKTCVYQNDKVYVLYGNCRKKESVTDITIVSKEGGSLQFYVENGEKNPEASKIQRDKYDITWSIRYTPSKPVGTMDMNAIKKFIADENDSMAGGCWVGDSFKAKEANATAKCHGDMNSKQADWAPSAESFWSNPPSDWYAAQNNLRKLVSSTN